MRQVLAYIEADVGMADDHTTAAWMFDLDVWGRCGQGTDEYTALAALSTEIGDQAHPVVVERITGDEQAFQRDQQPATDAERAATLAILAAARRDTLTMHGPRHRLSRAPCGRAAIQCVAMAVIAEFGAESEA